MPISLTPKLEELVKEKIASGYYNNASEVVREAIRLMDRHDQINELKLQLLQDTVRIGAEDVEKGRLSKKSVTDIFNAESKDFQRR